MPLTRTDIKSFHHELCDKRDELKGLRSASIDARKPVILDQQSVGRLSRVDAMQNQAMAQAQQRQRSQHLARIEQALKRIESDDFGFCHDCGGEIARNRLKIDPSVPLCIKCAARN